MEQPHGGNREESERKGERERGGGDGRGGRTGDASLKHINIHRLTAETPNA